MKAHTYIMTKHADAGTIAYMAPECFAGEFGVTEKSDVYSLGVLLWECITGSRPWENYEHQVSGACPQVTSRTDKWNDTNSIARWEARVLPG